MAPKRQRRTNVDIENLNKYKNIVIGDVLCPICRSILIEPVTLPCNHGFCLACFNGTMENTTLTCPLCRIRIGSWLRTARKENKVINNILWQTLQHKFPNEIQKRKEGEDLETDEKISIRLANPGEIRREYEIQLAKEQTEIQKQREAEEKASKVVIERILAEEEKVAKLKEEKLRLDAEIAKRLSNDLSNAGPSKLTAVSKKLPKKVSIDKYFMMMNKQKKESGTLNTSSINSLHPVVNQTQTIQKLANKSHTSTILCQNREKKNCSTAYKHLLLTKTLQREQNNSNGSDSGDSIKQEMRYFKPIRTVPKSVPKLLSDGNISIVPLIKVPAILAKKVTPVNVKRPNNTLNVNIFSNEKSAFVRLFPVVSQVAPKQTVDEPHFIVSESGKLIKQYYNKKRTRNLTETSTSYFSPGCSPVLGFEKETNRSDIIKMSAIVKSLSAKLNGETMHFKTVVNNNMEENLQLTEDSKNQIISQVNSSEFDQEKLDLEFARKLHEELNNPRYRAYSTRSQFKVSKKKSTFKKRQVTLDEFVAPKKFKI